MKAITLAITLFLGALPHDFYIAICTLHHNAEASVLEITVKATTHDLEEALSGKLRDELGSGTDDERAVADSALAKLMIENLIIEQHGESVQLEYLGSEVEFETTFCYLQAKGITDPEGLTVLFSLLFDTFPEQQNIVHLETSGSTLSHTFIRGSEPHLFTRAQ